MPAVSPCQGGLADQITSAPSDTPAKQSYNKTTPSRLDRQRLRWLVAALVQCPGLSPLELSAYVTLVWRGKRWLTSDRLDELTDDPERYRYGVVAGLESIAASVGRQRPGRAADGAAPTPNQALRTACNALVAAGLVDRENASYQDKARGRWHTEPYRWWRQKPKGVARVTMPRWADAVHMVRRLAVQQSVHGPARDSILLRLALAADERGQVTGTRDDIARICRVTPSTVIGHLQALDADNYGVARVFRADGGGRRNHVWHVRLEVVPDGVTPGDARREREAQVLDQLRAYNREQSAAAAAVVLPGGPQPGDDIPF